MNQVKFRGKIYDLKSVTDPATGKTVTYIEETLKFDVGPGGIQYRYADDKKFTILGIPFVNGERRNGVLGIADDGELECTLLGWAESRGERARDKARRAYGEDED